jgi:ATP-dependent exoDNAse (exonuclease V) beta subunit
VNKETKRLADKGKEEAAVYIQDMCAALMVISETCTSIGQLKRTVEDLFSDNRSDIVLSSIHRAKGLEADRVFILDYEKMPLDFPQPWARVQEQNIMYVALTRAKQELYLVGD